VGIVGRDPGRFEREVRQNLIEVVAAERGDAFGRD